MTRNYRKFFALLKQLPEASKEELVRQFTDGRTDSLQAMHTTEFQLMLVAMEGAIHGLNAHCADFDRWRKRVMAAIGGWLQLMENGKWRMESGEAKIKAIACRAAGKKRFNDITLSELRAIYAEFNNKQRVARKTKNLKTI